MKSELLLFPQETSTAAPRKRILIVEDGPALRSTLERILAKSQYSPLVASDARQAREMIARNSADLLLADIKMPGMSGVELLQWVKKNHPIPVILMTGCPTVLGSREASLLGANGLLAKPFRKQELLDLVTTCLPQPAKDTA